MLLFGLDIMSFLNIFQNTLTLISLLIVLMNINNLFFVITMFFIVPVFVINMYASKLKFEQTFNLTPLNRMISYLYSLITTRQPAKEIRLFDIKEEILNRWKGLYDKNASEQILLYSKTRKILFHLESVIIILSCGLITLALFLSMNGRITVGQFVALIQTTLQARTIIHSLSSEVSKIYETSLQSSQYFEFLELPEENLIQTGQEFPALRKGISIEELSMKYPGKDRFAIRNITLTINKGEKIAIVGENGAGKTTLTKCLLGLYTEYTGKISFDDIDISKIMKSSMRSNVTALFQDYCKFELPLRDNIAFGDIKNMNDLEAIKNAAKRGGVTDFLHNLSSGYDTLLGPSFLGGHELSIGQWQKVSLSRALMKNAQVVILDEPTSSLDPISEAKLIEDFITITEDKTAIIVSHRLGICNYVDRVIVLRNGQLVESGTHLDLLNKNGYYTELYENQSKWYV